MLKPRNGSLYWATSLALLWSVALILRFWGLDRFNTLVFDEVYFAKFGHNYLTQTPFFDAHPPLGKYLIALGIWLQGYSPWGYRWMNALVGSCIPLVIVGIAYRLTHRRRFALLAGTLSVLDGLLLVESRYALINVYLLFFGLLAHYCFLSALEKERSKRLWLTLTAICIGATAGVKWNGLGLVVGLYLLWAICWALVKFRISLLGPTAVSCSRLSPFTMLGYIGIIALLCYGLVWIPHLQQNSDYNVWQLHHEMFTYHQRVGSGPDVHPYCAPWHTWPLMQRPLSYFYQRATSANAVVPIYGPSLPAENAPWIFDVHAMGNPPLWWASTLAILILLGQMIYRGYTKIAKLLNPQAVPKASEFLKTTVWVPLYLCINYAANLLPWVFVSRCTFIYHYMPAATFSSLAAAWILDGWLDHSSRFLRVIAMMVLCLAILGFLFWLPIYLGLPLSQFDWNLRLRFRSWI